MLHIKNSFFLTVILYVQNRHTLSRLMEKWKWWFCWCIGWLQALPKTYGKCSVLVWLMTVEDQHITITGFEWHMYNSLHQKRNKKYWNTLLHGQTHKSRNTYWPPGRFWYTLAKIKVARCFYFFCGSTGIFQDDNDRIYNEKVHHFHARIGFQIQTFTQWESRTCTKAIMQCTLGSRLQRNKKREVPFEANFFRHFASLLVWEALENVLVIKLWTVLISAVVSKWCSLS